MSGFGSIGSFYFGPETKDVLINVETFQLQLSINDFILERGNNRSYENLNLLIKLIEPEIKIYESINVDFSASPVIGKSPLEVNFTALIDKSNTFSGSITQFNWYFDYENNPSSVISTSSTDITHIYSGIDQQKFTVKLLININPSDERILSKTKIDYIQLVKSSERFGLGKKINLTNYVPQYLKGTDTLYLVKTFEDYLNKMYEGDDGNIVSVETENNIDTISISSVNTSVISVLEKIYRIPELHDPELIDINNIQFFANNFGYNVNVNRNQFGVVGGNKEDVDKYLRFMVSNLPNWYKIKSTRNSIKSMLFSFGLIGDLVYYYTKDYSMDNINWMYGDIYFDENENKLKEDLSKIPNDWFPTSHFSVWFDINKSNTNYSYDTSKQKQILNAIESVRPANTVFRGVVGRYQTNKVFRITEVHKISKFIKIESNTSDYWAS